ncbi:MAG: DUF3459 domain-containing protein, partial [Planctomycetes bacterium]|nr:DUF3459 domain-containing protein [Planctomycetota bacterium]
DFDLLVKSAHEKGIRVILDMVMNHTSDQHPWFIQSRSSQDNPFHDWYLWRDPRPGGKPPNNWYSIFGGRGWEFDPNLGQYYFHMFDKRQPDLNWRNPAVRQAMLDVYRFWLERGVDGFRLDVFNAYFKHPALPDNPEKLGIRGFERQQHIYDTDQPDMLPLLSEIRTLLDSYSERYAVGETFLATAEKAAGYCGPHYLHGTFNFNLFNYFWWPRLFLKAIQRWEAALSPEAWPTWVLNNHDNVRSASRYGRGEDDSRAKVAAALLMSLRGTPFMYYGEEIGMRNLSLPRELIKDPPGKTYWPIYRGRDGCRGPMQWDDTAFAGFSQAEPWLPVHLDSSWRNVAAQRSDPDSLFNFYRYLINLRKEYPALREGLFLPLNFEPRTLLAYLRKTNQQTILVALNFANRPNRLAIGSQLARANWKVLLSNRGRLSTELRSGLLQLDPDEVCILLQC